MRLYKKRALGFTLTLSLSLGLLACAEPESVIEPDRSETVSFLKPSALELEMKNADAVGSVTATDLFEEYNRDRKAADEKYKGKVYIIFGRIGEVLSGFNIDLILLSEETVPQWLTRQELPLTSRSTLRNYEPLPGVKLGLIETRYGGFEGLSEFQRIKRAIVKGVIEGGRLRAENDQYSVLPQSNRNKSARPPAEITEQKPLNVYVQRCIVISSSYK